MASSDARTGHPVRTSVWLQEGPPGRAESAAGTPGTGRRGGQERPPGLAREKITAAAVRLLDAEGLGKFSMRRLAAELNVTAMSVYWYVRSKDDLLELALDAVEGEVPLPGPDEPDEDWPGRLRRLAHGYRRMFHDHPWATCIHGSYPNVGPRALCSGEVKRRIMRGSGLPGGKVEGCLAALFQFVLGFSTVEPGRAARSGEGECEDRDFEVALDCIIGGIEALGGRRATAGAPALVRSPSGVPA